MTQYIDLTRISNNKTGPNEPGSPPPGAWTHPVKPVWIRDLLDLWERNKLVALLLELATDRIAQDIRNPNTRRRTLSQIARYFVPQTGRGRRRRTASPNAWAAYSKLYRAGPLTPAYLVHIAAQNDMARAVVSLLHHSYAVGDPIALRDVRRHLLVRFGERSTVRASASAVMRTFAHAGVFAQGDRPGEYRYAVRLPVDGDIFPLLMWAWWRGRGAAVIELPRLADDPLLTFIDPASYAGYWAQYDGSLWTLETRDGADCAVLRPADNAAFVRTLFNLLSSHPKWPTVNRQFPEW